MGQTGLESCVWPVPPPHPPLSMQPRALRHPPAESAEGRGIKCPLGCPSRGEIWCSAVKAALHVWKLFGNENCLLNPFRTLQWSHGSLLSPSRSCFWGKGGGGNQIFWCHPAATEFFDRKMAEGTRDSLWDDLRPVWQQGDQYQDGLAAGSHEVPLGPELPGAKPSLVLFPWHHMGFCWASVCRPTSSVQFGTFSRSCSLAGQKVSKPMFGASRRRKGARRLDTFRRQWRRYWAKKDGKRKNRFGSQR